MYPSNHAVHNFRSTKSHDYSTVKHSLLGKKPASTVLKDIKLIVRAVIKNYILS